MNRRELFQAVSGVAAASGATVTASTIDADAKPVLAIIECEERISMETAARLREHWEFAVTGTPLEGVKVAVLSEGMTLTLLDAHGRPLNHRLEDEPLA